MIADAAADFSKLIVFWKPESGKVPFYLTIIVYRTRWRFSTETDPMQFRRNFNDVLNVWCARHHTWYYHNRLRTSPVGVGRESLTYRARTRYRIETVAADFKYACPDIDNWKYLWVRSPGHVLAHRRIPSILWGGA